MKASSSITLIHIVDGEDGISVISIDNQFAISNLITNIPMSDWNNNIPIRNEGEIIWKREIITYSDSTTKILSPHPITGDKGDTGTPGDISIGLGYKINHTSLTSSNDGEIFAHGFINGVAANINGWIYFEGTRYTVIVGYLNPGSVYNSFPYSAYIGVRKSSPSKIVAIRFDSFTKTFLFIDSENTYTGTVDESDWFIIGEFGMSNSELISYASFYNEGKSLAAIKEEELLKSGKLVIEWDSSTINIKALNNQGYISYNGNSIFFQSTSKTFSNAGEGIIIGNLNTNNILFCKVELGETLYNSQSVKTINFLDYESNTLITTRHEALVDYGFIKIGEFMIDDLGVVKTASIGESEPLESYLQKAFMKLFKIGNISSSNFEDWLDAIDLKNFYQTLVVSNLFVNALLANDGQFLNSLRISKDNIEGNLNDKLDKPNLFKDGITLNPDGSMQANWDGLDETTGYPKSGWKIGGDGQSFFKGATIIDANVQGLTADQISHNALTTVDEGDETTIEYTLPKNEWLGSDYFDQFEENHITRANHSISYDNKTWEYFLKTSISDRYLLIDTTPHTTSISAHERETIGTWTNTFGYPVYVKAKATLGGSMNEIIWSVYGGTKTRIVEKNSDREVNIILREGETLKAEGHSWALWGSQDASINYVYFYKAFNTGANLFIDYLPINHTVVQGEAYDTDNLLIKNILNGIVVPAWVTYVYIFVNNSIGDNWYMNYTGLENVFKVTINSSDIIYIPTNGSCYCSAYFVVDVSDYSSSVSLRFDCQLKRRDKDGDDDRDYLSIDCIDVGYVRWQSRIDNGFHLFSPSRNENAYFYPNNYYKTGIMFNEISSLNYLTKVNKADFISGLYNYISSDLRDSWLILKDATTHYLLIDGVATNIVQLFITSSYIKVMLTNGNVATLIQDTRYNSLQIHAISTASVESIETGHIIPKTTNRVIGQAGKEFQSAHINVITAPIIYSSSTSGYFKGKVYAG